MFDRWCHGGIGIRLFKSLYENFVSQYFYFPIADRDPANGFQYREQLFEKLTGLRCYSNIYSIYGVRQLY